ncbi:hypothetical protein FOCC_FOCC006145 [Frankliniella occidentalis]|nr:hypothetical protein FOCC_FOCC006145 [Frankliniella occidentalis]
MLEFSAQPLDRSPRLGPLGPRGPRGQLDQLVAAALPTTPLGSARTHRGLAAEGLARPCLQSRRWRTATAEAANNPVVTAHLSSDPQDVRDALFQLVYNETRRLLLQLLFQFQAIVPVPSRSAGHRDW